MKRTVSIKAKDFPTHQQFWECRDQKMLNIFAQMQADGIELEIDYEYDGNTNPQTVQYVSYRHPHCYATVVLRHADEYRLTLKIGLENHMTDSLFRFSAGCEKKVNVEFGNSYIYQSHLPCFFTKDAKKIGRINPSLGSFYADIDEVYDVVKWSMERAKAFKFDGFEYEFGQQYAMFKAEC